MFLCFALLGRSKGRTFTQLCFRRDKFYTARGEPVNIWGTADPDETVDITFLKKKYKTVADVQGNWKVTLPILKAGGPYTMAINDIELKDILIGDVWVCSGQSNMELPVSRVTDRFRDEISTDSNYPMVRYIKTPLLYNFHAPQADIPGISWQAMTPENVMPFSALAYFFAKDVYQKTKVPVGIINSSVGGSPVEAWISEEGLKPFPYYLNEKRIYESDKLVEWMKKEERKKSHAWNVALCQGDKGMHEATPWYAADYDDSNWTETDLFTSGWGNKRTEYRQMAPHWLVEKVFRCLHNRREKTTVRLGCIVDADSVYVNGTFVGTVSYQYPPRIYTIPASMKSRKKYNNHTPFQLWRSSSICKGKAL